MDNALDFSVIWANLAYFFIGRYPNGPIGGIALTIYLAAVSLVFSFVGGLVLGLLSVARYRVVRYVSLAVINVLRGLPLLMVIFWMFFLLPALTGGAVPETATVIFALTIFTSAYMAQIVRAGILAIAKGQTEAGVASGLSERQVMRYIILPQALRNMIPSFVNQFVSLIKDTSLAFIVGVSELTQVATQINNRVLIYPTEIFIFIALVYFLICFSLTSFSRWLEQKLAWHKAR